MSIKNKKNKHKSLKYRATIQFEKKCFLFGDTSRHKHTCSVSSVLSSFLIEC